MGACSNLLSLDVDDIEPGSLWKNLPSNDPQPCVVRVYCVRGIDLQPMDTNGRSDPYIRIHLNGKKIVSDSKNYIPATLNPTFGKMFEFEAEIPIQSELTVSVWDYDSISGDDLIGETTIDLENRLLAGCRASCGVPLSYATDGVNAWRDAKKPTEILSELCARCSFPPPVYSTVCLCVSVSVWVWVSVCVCVCVCHTCCSWFSHESFFLFFLLATLGRQAT